MSHIFISYSHKDSDYAHRLAEALEQKGFSVWIDDRIDYGTQWPQVIEERLDGCSAFIVIMTPRSYQSNWVQNELSYVQDMRKPIFPLLLEGKRWLSVASKQYVDVRGGRLPLPRFYETLANFAPRRTTAPPGPKPSALPQPAPRRLSTGLLAGIGVSVLVVVIGLFVFFSGRRGAGGEEVDPTAIAATVVANITAEAAKGITEPEGEIEDTVATAVAATEQAQAEAEQPSVVPADTPTSVPSPTNTPGSPTNTPVPPTPTATNSTQASEVISPEPGASLDMVLLPKFLGILVFDQAFRGAEEAAAELQTDGELQFLGPSPENSVAGQIDIVTTSIAQGVDAIMISNNAGDQIVPAAQAALESGVTVVTWDSPIPSAEGEQLFVGQVDFDETGQVMADMALNILGDNGGRFAILSASPDAANQNAWIAQMEDVLDNDPKYANLELLDIVYGNDQSEDSYNQALALVDKYPDMELIMAPTTIGIEAAAKAMQDEGLCDTIKVSGLGLPSSMLSYTLNGCAPEFALWSFVDLGYLTYYTTYLLASGQMEAEEGITFEAGRMGTYTIEKDPTRDKGLRVLMGWTVYNKDNVEAEAR